MAKQNLLQWDQKAWNIFANISVLLTCLLAHAKIKKMLAKETCFSFVSKRLISARDI
jgi:hypothetical protein